MLVYKDDTMVYIISIMDALLNMIISAGTCTYMLGGHCVIRLSEPLLKFRSKKDLLETLLVNK